MRSLVMVLVLAAACGDNADPLVHVSSEGASWAAVRVGDAWTRHDDVPFSFSVPPGARFEVVAVCRTDVGQGWTFIGRADEPWVFDWPCRYPDPPTPAVTFPVSLDVTGELDWAAMGGTYIDRNGAVPAQVAPGTWDLVAVRDRTFGGMVPLPTRIQLQRDVVVGGPLRIPVDVERLGVNLVPAEIHVGGERSDDTTAITSTEGDAWFSTFWPAEVLPPSAAVATDRVRARVSTGGSWASFDYTGPVDVVLPPEETDATFRWDPLPVADVWTEGDWRWISLRVSDAFVKEWTVWVAPDVAREEGRIGITAPPFTDWDPAWLPDPAAHDWEVEWSRARAGGGSEGRTVSGRVRPP